MTETKSVYLAFDLGATSWRAVLGWYDENSEIQIKEVHREKNIPIKNNSGVFWDIHRIFAGIIKVISELSSKNIEVKSIGIDSWSVDYALLDAQGELLELPRCYRDPRNENMLEKLSRYVDIDTLFNSTKVLAEDITTLCQLMAAKENTQELLEQADCLLFVPDLLRYWLCGKQVTDFTLATTSQLYNIQNKNWDYELLEQLRLPVDILPEIIHKPGIIGYLSDEIQKQTGMGGIPVVIGASHDTAAAFSIIDDRENTVVLSAGTWSILGVFVSGFQTADTIDYMHFGYEGNVDGSFRLVHNVPGMYLLEKCIDAWSTQKIDVTYEALIDEAREYNNIHSRLDPFWQGFNEPESMPDAIVEYCRSTSQTAPQTVGEYVRIIFESLAGAYAVAIDIMQRLTEKKLTKILIIGGASRNSLLNKLIGAATKLDVCTGNVEATSVGNIMNQQ